MRPKAKKTTKIAAGIVSILLVIGLLVGSAGIYILYRILETTPTLHEEDFLTSDSTIIYDKNGEIIGELGLYLRQNISYNDMSSAIVDAFVAVEDSRYFEHSGFDTPRFTKAFIENIKSRSFSQGGSTFTMQLIKNTYFQIDDDEVSTIAEKSIDRKTKEIYLALQLEKIMTKEKIFEHYLNKLNFGKNIRGVEKASQYYFGKNASDVTISEAALLAGIINLPNRYNPYDYLDYATERRNTVLDLMLYHGYIDELEYKLAKSIKVEDQLVGESDLLNPSGGPYQSYIDAAVAEAYQLTGYDPVSQPMLIYTHMDPIIQNEIDKIQDGGYEDIQFKNELKQIAMVSMNNQTGAIVGLGGGRNYDGARMFNRATDMYMQPGSTVKPFFNYALAFEHLGWASSHVVLDQPIKYRGTNIPIYNFNRRFYGDVAIKFAHGISLNTPVIQSIQEIADKKGVDYLKGYLRDLGFSKIDDYVFDLGYAIGGSGFIVSPVELAGAHAMLLNEGEYIKPHTISKITFAGGKEIVQERPNAKQVLSPESAYLVSTLTRDSVEFQYNNYMQILRSPYPVYGKTGTSDWGKDAKKFNIPEGAPKDRWMVASTTEYTNLIWEGFDKGEKDKKTWLTDEDGTYNIRGKALRILLDTLYPKNTTKPKGVAKPSGISSITHIEGTWPYANPVDGIGNVITGEIKSEYKKLVSVYDTPSNNMTLNGISANRFEDGSYRVDFSGFIFQDETGAYKRNMILEAGGKTIHSTGNVIFDYSWVNGSPSFVAKIYQGNEVINEVSGDSASLNGYLDPSISGNLKACGYFYYANGSASNEKCTTLR